MIESILFQPLAFVFLGTSTAAAAALGATVRAAKREDTALLRAVEAGVLTFMGGFLARSFILLLLSLAGDTQQAGLVLGWGFFLWPGLIDTLLIVLKGAPALTTPEALAWIATAVGAFTGMLAGVWGSHRWYGLGWLAFPLDVTWGLAGSTNACLLHLVNFAWAGHADAPADRRRENHRYVAGFAFKSGFAFTQGSVMSNLHLGPGTDLWGHENTHVWQNRLFGPLFTLGYLAWAILLFLPSLFVAATTRSNLGDTIMALCYYNLPWEVWAYKVGGWRNPFMAWGDAVVLLASVLFFGAFVGLSLPLLVSAW